MCWSTNVNTNQMYILMLITNTSTFYSNIELSVSVLLTIHQWDSLMYLLLNKRGKKVVRNQGSGYVSSKTYPVALVNL